MCEFIDDKDANFDIIEKYGVWQKIYFNTTSFKKKYNITPNINPQLIIFFSFKKKSFFV
jgi:hypothetical protein